MNTTTSTNLSQNQQQTLALAAVMQAANAVQNIAEKQQFDDVSALIDSIYVIDPKNFQDVFPDPHLLLGGLKSLESFYCSKQALPSKKATISTALGLLQLANLLDKDADVKKILQLRLQSLIAKRALNFNDSPAYFQLASAYVDSVGSFAFRIQVQGKVEYLQQENNVEKIRSILLAGLRAALLWKQLGGKRWHLIFKKHTLQKTIQSLVERYHDV